MTVGLSYSTYANRDFTVATRDTVELREVPVPVSDTLSSRGGLSDFRLAAAYKFQRPQRGGGVAFTFSRGPTGWNRAGPSPTTSICRSEQSAELSYAGVGASVGAVQQLGAGAVGGRDRAERREGASWIAIRPESRRWTCRTLWASASA